jgi:hypothetical protein
VLLWVGRVPSLEHPLLGILDLARNDYMLAKTKLCLALKRFGAFIFVLHIGELSSVETSTTRTVDTIRLLSLLLILYIESPISATEIYPKNLYHTEGDITLSLMRKCTKLGLIYLYLI